MCKNFVRMFRYRHRHNIHVTQNANSVLHIISISHGVPMKANKD